MKLLMTFVLLLTVHEFYIPPVQAETKCENIDQYSEEYIAVWTIFIESVQSHPEMYNKDPDSLTPDEYETMEKDLITLISGLANLTPPPGLRSAWAVEISYWATYVALLNSSSDFGSSYAAAEYGLTMQMIQDQINKTTRLALGYCPVWQDTIDELNEMIDG